MMSNKQTTAAILLTKNIPWLFLHLV